MFVTLENLFLSLNRFRFVRETSYEAQSRFYRSDKDVGLLPETELLSTDLDSSSAFVFVAPGEFYIWFGNNVGLNQRKTTEAKAVEG